MGTPIQSVIVDAVDVGKTDTRDFVDDRLIQRFASVATVQSLNLTRMYYLVVGTTIYWRDSSDTTSAHDGVTTLVDSGGNRWKSLLGDSNINPRGAYSAVVEYSLLDLVENQNASWLYLNGTPSTGNDPPTLPTTANSYWMLYAKGGDKEKYHVWDNDRPASGEIIGRWLITEDISLDAGLPDSQASADIASTGSAVFTIRKTDSGTSPSDEDFGTVTFSAGVKTGAFVAANAVSFAAGDILKIIAPDPRDATLSGISIVVVGSRS